MIEVLRTRLADRARTLGWHLSEASLAQLHLVADGRTIQPDINGLVVRFVLPTEARDVRLVSDASIAAHVLPGSTDGRQLGVAVAELSIDDGLTGLRRIALDDPRLETGFHPLDGQGGRRQRGALALDRWQRRAAGLPLGGVPRHGGVPADHPVLPAPAPLDRPAGGRRGGRSRRVPTPAMRRAGNGSFPKAGFHPSGR